MWCASVLNLWLKYRSKVVDLARLKRTCTVNDRRARRDPSRKDAEVRPHRQRFAAADTETRRRPRR